LRAKAHQKVRRQRQDFHHQVALQLVQRRATINHEDVRSANMIKNQHPAKSISDAGWSQFLRILSVKAVCAGRKVVAVNPAFTSQTCSGCGVMVQKGFSVRWRSCPACGTSLHQDQNAAKNREWLGQSLRSGVAFATAENREAPGFSHGGACHLLSALGERCDWVKIVRKEPKVGLRIGSQAFRDRRASPLQATKICWRGD
jgi:IS605 OrfB family transposase